jgi:hypothetical protein
MFTFADGLFSYLTYDLRIDVNSFKIEIGGSDHFIRAHFDAKSLRVNCAMKNGVERPDLLNEVERSLINRIMLNDILDADNYPDIMLVSSSVKKENTNLQVKGPVFLHGQEREIAFNVKLEDQKGYVADLRLHMPAFGIKHFSFLLGAVKIRPDILVHIELPVDCLEFHQVFFDHS